MKKWLSRLDDNKYVEFSSPVTLGFVLLSLIALLMSTLTGGAAARALFSVYRAPMSDLLSWPRLFLHVLGHANLTHFVTNMSLLLVLGPIVEKHYGSGRLAMMMALTALVTGIFSMLLSPNVAILGASGIVFMLIFLAAAAGQQGGRVPLTLILVAVIYLGREIIGLFSADSVSQLSHIVGGLCGIALGLGWNRKKTYP